MDDHIKLQHEIDLRRLTQIRDNMPDAQMAQDLAQIFASLSDPTRLRIILALQLKELCVHEIAEVLGHSVSAVSHQLRLLKNMKLVKYRKQGKMVFYSLDDHHIEQLIAVATEHADE